MLPEQWVPRQVHYLGGKAHGVGRIGCDLKIPHTSVTRKHGAFIHLSAEGAFVADISSTNGTFVNGQRVPAHTQVPLLDGNKISFGSVEFSFMLPETVYEFVTSGGKSIPPSSLPVDKTKLKAKRATVPSARLPKVETVVRHPSVQPIGKPPNFQNLMAKACQPEGKQSPGKPIWLLSHLPKVVTALFMIGALAYIIYVFLIR